MMRFLLATSFVLVITGCAVEPPPRPTHITRTAALAPEPERPTPEVYAYPLKGQSAEQQDRDRYECYGWAVKQTGFDPSAASLAPHERVRVVAGPAPGSTTAAGAVTGAAVGAIASGPHSTGEGAVVGAIAGAVIGAAVESQQQQRVAQTQQAIDEQHAQEHAQASEQVSNYRRALGACLEARGYTVR